MVIAVPPHDEVLSMYWHGESTHKILITLLLMGEGLIAPATSTTQNFTKKIKKIFCINVNKNAK